MHSFLTLTKDKKRPNEGVLKFSKDGREVGRGSPVGNAFLLRMTELRLAKCMAVETHTQIPIKDFMGLMLTQH